MRLPALLLLGLTAACASTPRATATPTPTPAPADAATAADAPPPMSPAPAFSVAEPLDAAQGVILAERPGATVTLHPAQGPDLALADGERVTFIDDQVGVGQGDATATVEARGVRGVVPNARVVLEERLSRGPDRRVAVFSAVATCGDVCHTEVWLLGPEVGRAQITSDASPDVVVAWSPDGSRVATGGGSLHVTTTRDGRAGSIPDVTSPAWAPNGTLFARGANDDDAIFEVSLDAPPRRLYAPPGRRPPPPDGAADSDPAPVHFEQNGRVLRAVFLRPGRVLTARVNADGTGGRVLSPAAAAAEQFFYAQMLTCNVSRRRVNEGDVFPLGTEVTALRAAGAAQIVRVARPNAEPVEVAVDARAQRIRHPRGAAVALPGGLDFCPAPVWQGPHND